MTADTDTARAHMYRLLAVLLAAPPTADILDLVYRSDDPSELQSRMADAWQRLKSAGINANADQLDEEYHRLFVGLGCGELIPYGSWYQAGALMGKPLARLRSDLATLGIERQPDIKETEDHAAALLESMAMMCSPTDGFDAETQRQFFNDHIAGWLGLFFSDLQQAMGARFYKAVGTLGAVFLDLEKNYLAL
jgi:TorA maturation chaperone TorD